MGFLKEGLDAAAAIPEAPTDGSIYGRGGAVPAWVPVLPSSEAATQQDVAAVDVIARAAVMRAGDTMTGPLSLFGAPVIALHAATKQYVDNILIGQNLYQGTWQVAANVPPMNPPVPAPQHGWRWLCLTADPEVPENPPAGMSGLNPATTFISDGSFIIWDAQQVKWDLIKAGALTKAEADALYLALSGGVLSGPLTLPGDPTQPLQAATKQYVDQAVTGTSVGPWSTLATGIGSSSTARARWLFDPATAVQLKGYLLRSDNGVIGDNEILGTVDPAFRPNHQNHFAVTASNFTGSAWGIADVSISETDGALRVHHLPGTPADVATVWLDGIAYGRD